MRNSVVIVAILSVVLFCSAAKEKPVVTIFENDELKVQYETRNGLYDGKYTSWYKNGKKKAEGSFKNNMRYGTWTVWDSTGRKRMVRDYKNTFEFTVIFPAPVTEGPIPLLSEPKCKPERNASGYYPYCYLFERAVAVSKRVWRYLPKDKNNPLFANDDFYHAFVDSVIAGKLKAYDTSDDEFRILLTGTGLERLKDTIGYEVIGYNIKEDWFFDSDRMLSETRTIGLSPVVRSKKILADSFEICCFYFPYVRATLAAQTVRNSNVPDYILNLDDVFYFRYFRSAIYKESNIYNRTLKEDFSGQTLIQARIRVETGIIELEHDTWIFYSR